MASKIQKGDLTIYLSIIQLFEEFEYLNIK